MYERRDCEFFLDFSRGVLEAHSLFEVSTVGGGGPGAPETLEIAHIKGTACVDTRTQVSCCCGGAVLCVGIVRGIFMNWR